LGGVGLICRPKPATKCSPQDQRFDRRPKSQASVAKTQLKSDLVAVLTITHVTGFVVVIGVSYLPIPMLEKVSTEACRERVSIIGARITQGNTPVGEGSGVFGLGIAKAKAQIVFDQDTLGQI